MITEADAARQKIRRAYELLDPFKISAPAGRMERMRALLDGAIDDIDALERKAYLVIRLPSFLRRAPQAPKGPRSAA